jgi:hypothetical protein
MSMAYLAQPADQQQLEWLDGGTLAMLLDGAATDGQLMIGRFDVARGEAPPSARLPHHLRARGPADDQHAGRYRGHVPRDRSGQGSAPPGRLHRDS